MPRILTEVLTVSGAEAERRFAAVMTMKKIDVARIITARRGEA